MGYRFESLTIGKYIVAIPDGGAIFGVNFYSNCIGLLRKFYGNGSVLSNVAQFPCSFFLVYFLHRTATWRDAGNFEALLRSDSKFKSTASRNGVCGFVNFTAFTRVYRNSNSIGGRCCIAAARTAVPVRQNSLVEVPVVGLDHGDVALVLTAALALTALTACSSLPASAASVDYDTAVKIAADHLGCDVSDLKVIERDYDDGKYELDILVGDVKYEYEIGASSGKVLKAERDRRDWDDRYDDDWDDRYDDDWDDRYDDDWDD